MKQSQTTMSAQPAATVGTKLHGSVGEERGALEGLTATGVLRVLCVDDHVVLVEGLRAFFKIEGSIEIVGRLSSAARLLEEVDHLLPDVVILDIEMPGPDAFEMTDRMRRRHPEVRVVVLSAHIRDAFISSSFRAGVSGYFAKSDDLEDIARGIKEVARSGRGAFVLGPKVRERCRPLIEGSTRSKIAHGATDESPVDAAAPKTLLDTLTPREEEILRLIGKGLSRTQIASELCRSAKTVDAHQSRMMKKLGIEARADLMRFAIREGLAQA
jgi:two-component system nitrate/nitrite response regulator NarL